MTRIGLFDSGLGGLTVLKELLTLLPNESYIYFGDTARVPYGTKSPETIMRYAFENTTFIIQHDVDLLIIPCNTVCSIALANLQKCYSIPIVGVIEAACETALASSCHKRIGVIGTKTTIRSGAYEKELRLYAPDAKIFSAACPLFVPFVEEQLFLSPLLQPLIRHYLSPLKKKNIDTLVLGCTHYPLLAPFIKKELSDSVTIVDPAKACAKKAVQIKNEKKLVKRSKPNLQFFVSDDPDAFKAFGEAFLNVSIKNIQKISPS
jgi:glutamate racemase